MQNECRGICSGPQTPFGFRATAEYSPSFHVVLRLIFAVALAWVWGARAAVLRIATRE